MAKLLLDELFFNRDNTDNYIDDVIKFISKYFEDDIVFFHPYCDPSNLWMLKNQIASIELKVMKNGKIHICDLNLIDNLDVNNNLLVEKYCEEFAKKVKYICQEYNDVIIFNAPENHAIDVTRPCEHVYLINHIKQEIDSNIAFFIINQLFMMNITEPTLESPLPNIDLCDEYKIIQDNLIIVKDIQSRIQIFLKVVSEVLKRNSYIYDEFLSSINTTSRKIREIYKKVDSSLYGSIDIDTGSIEICDHNGHHIDEYGFDNEKHNKHDPTGKHDIKLHR